MAASSSGPRRGVENLVLSLQESIAIGDANQAQVVASILAQKRTVIDMNTGIASNTKEDDLMIKVYIEDRTSSCCIPLKVKKNAKIKELKLKMLQDYGFPPEVQKWIVGKRLPSDNDTLHKLGVKTPDTPLFLYLFPAKKVGLSKEEFLRMYARETPQDVLNKHFEGVPRTGDIEEVDNTVLQAAGGVSPTAVVGASAPFGARQQRIPVAEVINFPSVNVSEVEHNVEGGQHNSEEQIVGWQCSQCTYINLPTRPGCSMCSAERPLDYKPPDGYIPTGEEQDRLIRLTEEEQQAEIERNREIQRRRIESLQNFAQLVQTENQDLVPNVEEFDCPICFELIEPGHGVVLRECLHSFCKECLADSVKYNEEPTIKCPYMDGDIGCAQVIQEREIKALVTPEIHQKYLQRGLATAENQAENSYHCKTPNCQGWCIYEDAVNTFQCPVCNKANCLTCKAIHEGMNCKQYQEDLAIRASNDVAAKQTREMLERLVQSGEAMHCPKCKIILQKKEGCDWLRCTMCHTEVCWVTKQARWGPGGAGDTSGGCKCRVNGRMCHPNCGNCH